MGSEEPEKIEEEQEEQVPTIEESKELQEILNQEMENTEKIDSGIVCCKRFK